VGVLSALVEGWFWYILCLLVNPKFIFCEGIALDFALLPAIDGL
jgi:hypothetical protein